MTSPLVHDRVWLDKCKYDDAERQYYEKLAKLVSNGINKRNVNPNTDPKTMKVTKFLGKGPVPNAPKVLSLPLTEKNQSFASNASTGHATLTQTWRSGADSVPVPEIPLGIPEVHLKPKDVKEKRNKADKKGREKRIANKEDIKGSPNTPSKNSLAGEVAKARQHIKHSLECMDNVAALTGNVNVDLASRVAFLEKDNAALHKKMEQLQALLESRCGQMSISQSKPVSQDVADKEAEAKKEALVKAYNAKKATKPALIAKSNIILDVKPWDDETNMKDLETRVREVSCDGLLWGASKLVPLAYGIHKLQISCVVEDEKVSVDWLQETLEAIEDYVQSVDIAAFNKV